MKEQSLVVVLKGDMNKMTLRVYHHSAQAFTANGPCANPKGWSCEYIAVDANPLI